MVLNNFSCISQLHGPGLSYKALLFEESVLDHICFCVNLHL